MQGITKETFLKADDPRNRDAILFDLLVSINNKINIVAEVKEGLAECEKHISYIRGVGAAISIVFSVLMVWLFKS